MNRVLYALAIGVGAVLMGLGVLICAMGITSFFGFSLLESLKSENYGIGGLGFAAFFVGGWMFGFGKLALAFGRKKLAQARATAPALQPFLR